MASFIAIGIVEETVLPVFEIRLPIAHL